MALLARLFAFRMPSLVSSFSAAFLFVFLPLCLILMALLPSRAKKYGLLLLSIGFSWLIGGPLVLWLLFSVALAFGFGLWLESVRKKQEAALKETPKEQKKEVKRRWLKRSRRILALGLFLDLGALIGLKYTPFILENVNRLSQAIGGRALVSLPHILIPLGISFYSMQCAAYLFDVYRGSISADRNPFRLALFMTYFPQIAEGPICRYQQTAQALWNIGPIRFENLTHGLQRILYGMMKKLVVADRLNPFVSAVFTDYASYPGGVAALGALAYTVQLYMDFSGAMDVALGLSQILGVTLPENFRRPFFSRSVSEFWTAGISAWGPGSGIICFIL
ncbi:MAG: hypothetical protein J6H18_04120 [Lachnospiraceae bacterium]|nr:hypothetical protein [Lachnospiraceae bacterium]